MAPPRKIRKLLIANRGEIAVRILRTCRRLDIRTVAVFSEADRAALHVQLADEAYPIGPPPSASSYLVIDTIVATALACGADAIHPGYGFLSERAGFAEACAAAGLVFVGPPPGAIRAMGDKTAARALMQEAGVPMAPGSPDAISALPDVRALVDAIGYPVLIKAAAGGGGKGMRLVASPEELGPAFDTARREAGAAFGDDRVFVEKYIVEPRHIEIQVLADTFGHTVHLFERECSIQRRHQKVVEEAPSSLLTPDVRNAMGEAAVRAARVVRYVGAGTVEFLVDRDLRFYFMEMNTRLQVEHPVTECITGLDLVAEQIRIAEGEPLGYEQTDLSIAGHAIECRIYAEDPARGFLPDPGRLHIHRPPSGPGVRVDAGVEEGGEIPLFYDPMIAKLVVSGATRAEAIARMDAALSEYRVAGVQTTIPFCRFVMQHEAFRSGRFSTHFVADHFSPERLAGVDAPPAAVVALSAALLARRRSLASPPPAPSTETTAWRARANRGR